MRRENPATKQQTLSVFKHWSARLQGENFVFKFKRCGVKPQLWVTMEQNAPVDGSHTQLLPSGSGDDNTPCISHRGVSGIAPILFLRAHVLSWLPNSVGVGDPCIGRGQLCFLSGV